MSFSKQHQQILSKCFWLASSRLYRVIRSVSQLEFGCPFDREWGTPTGNVILEAVTFLLVWWRQQRCDVTLSWLQRRPLRLLCRSSSQSQSDALSHCLQGEVFRESWKICRLNVLGFIFHGSENSKKTSSLLHHVNLFLFLVGRAVTGNVFHFSCSGGCDDACQTTSDLRRIGGPVCRSDEGVRQRPWEGQGRLRQYGHQSQTWHRGTG